MGADSGVAIIGEFTLVKYIKYRINYLLHSSWNNYGYVISLVSCICTRSASNYPHSSVILRKLGLKYGIRKSSSKYGKVGIN